MNIAADLDDIQKRLNDIERALDASSIVAFTNPRGVITYANEKFCEVSQYSREELIGSKQNIVNSGHHPRAFFKKMWRTIGQGNIWNGEIKNKAKDGSYYWVDTTIIPFMNEAGKPYQYISIRHNITQRKLYEEYMESMAYSDPLTGLPNRNQFSRWVMDYPGKENQSITTLFLDLDRFKSINDNHGHDTGDQVLVEAARRLENILDGKHFVSRQGGDEFIIILNHYEHIEEVEALAKNILASLADPYFVNQLHITASASIGISYNEYSATNQSLEEFVERLIKQADTAMYHAKRQGGNRYCFNTDEQNMELHRTYQLEKEIRHALRKNEFYIAYQPIVNIKTKHIIGVEALLRWKNAKLGNVSPGEFIPLLEELGDIKPVGKWIFSTVFRQMKQWQEKGILLEKVCVNVSPVQFREQGFVNQVKEILNQEMLDASYLEIEITEGVLFDFENSSKKIMELKELGAHVSIDDFGTGYSSLSYLKQLPIDTLKIDKSFIDELDYDGKIIVNTIIDMGQNLNFRLIAEGIETKEQLSYLEAQKCPEGQGYYFSKPMAPEEITYLMK